MTDETRHVPIPEHWTFKDEGVAAGFEGHVREQLPWYEMVTAAIVQIGRHYIGQGGLVYDVCASTGNVSRALESIIKDRDATCISVEESEEMAAQWQGPGTLEVRPAQTVDYQGYDLAVVMLGLMFLRADEQSVLLERLHRSINPGGALIVVERMLPPSGYLSIVTSRLTLAAKLDQGATADEVISKELSLAGAQRPVDARVLLAHGAVEWFRFGDFAGWVIEKELPRRL